MRTATARPAGWWARLLLLACTLLGLAAMHTIGHGTHSVASHPDGHAAVSQRAMVAQAAGPEAVPVAHGVAPEAVPAAHVAGPVSFAGQVGAVALPADQPGGAPSRWSVCLAVLGAVTVALLLATLLLGRAHHVVATRHPSGPSRGPRAPPPRPVGLRLATVSVLRR
ncbi:hypothetical protein [Micromonospora sp. U56]|uniref:hypothetical protein n=1 Tax=Micromonospora sp. U56 TaxID=2824900 RepID=UPI001FFD6104|nr:hypothetical protein [Micromonospora sp. U56]